MTEPVIELDNVVLDFPLQRSRTRMLEVITSKLGLRSEKSMPIKESVVTRDLGSTILEWPSQNEAVSYRLIVRNFDDADEVDKRELRGTKYIFNWNIRKEGDEYGYRIQYRTEPDSDWIDTDPNYTKLIPPTPIEISPEGDENLQNSKSLMAQKNSFRAVDAVSLQIRKGEVVGIIGENGSGKTTLLRLIGGIYAPDSGSIKTKGRITLLIGLGAGFENEMTGRENIMMTGSIYGIENKILEEIVPEIIEFSGIDHDFIDLPIKTYSSGMRSRLGFSIVSHLEPEILLLDEVMSAGDYDFRKKSQKRILEMVEGNATTVIVSHDIGILENLCDRVFAMKGGKIVTSGDIDEAISVYESTK